MCEPIKFNEYRKDTVVKVRFTIALALASIGAIAETDRFDMALSGDFYKDYCELTVLMNDRYTRLEPTGAVVASLNVPPPPPLSTLPPPPETDMSWYEIQVTKFELKCSEGDYTVDLKTDMPMEVIDEAENIKYETQLRAFQDGNDIVIRNSPLSVLGGFTRDFAMNPADPAKFTVGTLLKPIDGDFNNLPDTYSHSVNVIFTIEKK